MIESGSAHFRRKKCLEFRLWRIYNVETFWQGAAIMEAVIRKWGNSPALRLPVAVIKEADFNLEQKVNISVTRGRIVIEPSDTVEYDLDQLLSGITATNTHGEVSFGSPVGKEVL
jgi:antitoxin MazE